MKGIANKFCVTRVKSMPEMHSKDLHLNQDLHTVLAAMVYANGNNPSSGNTKFLLSISLTKAFNLLTVVINRSIFSVRGAHQRCSFQI